MSLIRKHLPAAVFLASILCAGTGCGSRQPRIEGNVTLDGVPVDGGSIVFLLSGGAGGGDKANAPIVGGKYVIEGERAKTLMPGSYAVQIHWLQRLVKPGFDPNSADDSAGVKQLIPPQYNSKSTLTREIAAGTNKLDFDLKSK